MQAGRADNPGDGTGYAKKAERNKKKGAKIMGRDEIIVLLFVLCWRRTRRRSDQNVAIWTRKRGEVAKDSYGRGIDFIPLSPWLI